jgi:predicted nucleic acid-binding Zn ribbon protein
VANRDIPSARDLLPAVLGRLARNGGPVQGLQAVWEQEVGARLGKQTQVTALHGDVLHIRVPQIAYADALQRDQDMICERMTRRLGGPAIRTLRVEVG